MGVISEKLKLMSKVENMEEDDGYKWSKCFLPLL